MKNILFFVPFFSIKIAILDATFCHSSCPLTNDYDLSARRAYFHGGDFGKQEEGTVERTKVCPIEIWCELFQGDKKDFTPARSKEIKDVILKTGEWTREAKHLKFGKLYGIQRGFKRIESEEDIPLF